MKTRKSRSRAKIGSSKGSGMFLESKDLNSMKIANRRSRIKTNIKKTLAVGSLNLGMIGKDGSALSALKLNKISDRDKRRLLGRLVAAAGRRRG